MFGKKIKLMNELDASQKELLKSMNGEMKYLKEIVQLVKASENIILNYVRPQDQNYCLKILLDATKVKSEEANEKI